MPLLPDQDPMAQAMEHGLPLAVFYLGLRSYTVDEMRAPRGTIYIPGDKSLPLPSVPPMLPATCYPLVDPIAKMAHPAEYTTVYDGGDVGLKAGFDKNGRLVGVDPSDTVAVYVNSKGQKKIACSNAASPCASRGSSCSAATPSLDIRARRSGRRTRLQLRAPDPHAGIGQHLRHPRLSPRRPKSELAAERRTRLAGSTNFYGTSVVGTVRGLEIKATIAATQIVDGLKRPVESKEEVPLIIIKWPDRHGVLPGELLTFYLRYTNPGKLPITDVAVVDNLTTRFEYVPGTSKTDRDGTFTFQPNQAGSSLLQLQDFTAPLQPGESGTISFQVKVR